MQYNIAYTIFRGGAYSKEDVIAWHTSTNNLL